MTRNIALAAVCLVCMWLAGCSTSPLPRPEKQTFSSFNTPAGRAAERQFDTGMLKFEDAEIGQVLAIYQEVSGRTVLSPSTLPPVKISLRNETPLNRVEALQLLDTALAQNGITMVLLGDVAVKALPSREAVNECAPTINLPADALPRSSSYMTRTVRLKKIHAADAVSMLSPLAKMPNAIIGIKAGNLLILRDYSSNIREMLHLLQELEGTESP